MPTSGGLTLLDVPVDELDVQSWNTDPHAGFRHSLFQLVLLAVAAGSAQAAVNDAVSFVKPRRRTLGFPGKLVPRHQDIVQTVLGQAASKAHATRLIVRAQAGALSDYADDYHNGYEELQDLTAETLAVETFQAQQVVLSLALETATEIFEVGGASATSTQLQLDRHWRNIRTVANHNPAKYRARAVGDYLLNGDFRLWGGDAPLGNNEVTTQSEKTQG